MQQMRDELKKINTIYENKMNQELSYQYNYMSLEIERLKEIIRDSEGKISKQQIEITALKEKINKVQKKTDGKVEDLHR